MPAAATLYLEVNSDKVKAGAAQAATSLRTLQQQATATGSAMERAALSNQAYTLSVDAMSGELIRIPVLMEQAKTSTGAFGTILSTIGKKLTDVGGYAKSFAGHIKGMLLGATVFSAIAASIGLVEGAIRKLWEPTEEETRRIKAMTAALEEFRAASEKVAGTTRAQQRFTEVGDTKRALEQREQRLQEVIKEYESAVSGIKGGTVGESFFTKLGVPAPKGGTNFIPSNQVPSLSGGAVDTSAQGLSYVAERQFTIDELNKAFSEYVAAEERAIAADKKAADTATATGKARLDMLTQLAQAYNRLHGISENADAAAAGAGKVGLNAGAAQAAVATYENIVARLRVLMPRTPEKDDAAAELKRKSDEARNRLHEQQLADIEQRDALATAKRKAAAEKAASEAEHKFQQSASGFASGFESAASGLLHGMTSVGGAFEAFAQSVAETVLQQQAIEPSGQAVGAGLASLFASSGTAARYGKVFDQQGVTPFAVGGIVTRPTHFAYGGGIGLMGEEGPEAVVPLKRGRDGRLGIAGAGGQTTINVNVQGVDDHRGMRPAARQAAIALDRSLRRGR